MYEICVGRTPFEANSKEEFLTKEALEVYYQRTLTNRFYGEHNISPSFASLISQMVESDVDMRMQTCAQAEEHEFFASPKPIRRPKLGSSAAGYLLSRLTVFLCSDTYLFDRRIKVDLVFGCTTGFLHTSSRRDIKQCPLPDSSQLWSAVEEHRSITFNTQKKACSSQNISR